MEEGVDAFVETVRVSCGGIMPAHKPRTHISVALDVPEAGKLPKTIGLSTVGGGLDATGRLLKRPVCGWVFGSVCDCSSPAPDPEASCHFNLKFIDIPCAILGPPLSLWRHSSVRRCSCCATWS